MKFITLNMYYGKILEQFYSGEKLDNILKLMLTSGLTITPQVYTIMSVGYNASFRNRDLWNRQIVQQKYMVKILEK